MHACIFHNYHKISTVKPLCRKGEKVMHDYLKYISLLTDFSKVLEEVMYNRLSLHMHTNNTLVIKQIGFM
jgi:hypothetical protein